MLFSNEEIATLATMQAKTGIYEKIIEAAYTLILTHGDEAIDGGAHGGMHTLPMARCVGPNGIVYAFEPIPQICDWLRHQTKSLPQVKVCEAALADRAGVTEFHFVTDEPWYSSVTPRPFITTPIQKIIAFCWAMDALADRAIRFIKLDLEGGEYHALKGGLHLLRRQRPIVIVEWGGADAAKISGFTAEDYFGQLHSVGYITTDLFGQPFGIDDFPRPHGQRPEDIAAIPLERGEVPSLLAECTTRMLHQCLTVPSSDTT